MNYYSTHFFNVYQSIFYYYLELFTFRYHNVFEDNLGQHNKYQTSS